jgi:hypothetical protein
MMDSCSTLECVRPTTRVCRGYRRPCCGRHSAVVYDGGFASSIVCERCMQRAGDRRAGAPRSPAGYPWQKMLAGAAGWLSA